MSENDVQAVCDLNDPAFLQDLRQQMLRLATQQSGDEHQVTATYCAS